MCHSASKVRRAVPDRMIFYSRRDSLSGRLAQFDVTPFLPGREQVRRPPPPVAAPLEIAENTTARVLIALELPAYDRCARGHRTAPCAAQAGSVGHWVRTQTSSFLESAAHVIPVSFGPPRRRASQTSHSGAAGCLAGGSWGGDGGICEDMDGVSWELT